MHSLDPFDASCNPLTLVTEPDLAARWQKSVRTLQRWRYDEQGPAHVRIGGTIFYRLGDILAFEDAARHPEGPRR